MNDELEMWKEVVVAYFKISCGLSAGTEENLGNPQSQ
jgi:hypothetical protein